VVEVVLPVLLVLLLLQLPEAGEEAVLRVLPVF